MTISSKCLIAAVLLWSGVASAATINAASAALADVQAAVNSATSGDTVQVPAGTATWTGTLTVSKNISLIGSGIGQTVVRDEVANRSAALVAWTATNGPTARLSGFTFQGSSSVTEVGFNGSIQVSGDSKTFMLDNCHFDLLYNNSVLISGVYGVAFSNRFDQRWANGITVRDSGWGDTSWATPSEWGGTNRFYIEDNTFVYGSSSFGPGINDGFRGARVVIRHNTITNLFIQGHGTESAQRQRGTRLMEVYNNKMVSTDGTGTALFLRSGSGVIFSNTISGFTFGSFASLNNFRSTGHFSPWNGATGDNPWDTNNASGILDSGTHTGSDGSSTLTDSTKSWSANQWVGAGYVVKKTTGGESISNPFRQISGNGTTTITTSSDFSGQVLTWTTGDTYVIRQVLVALDQIGRGQGDLLSGDTPINTVTGTPAYPRQALEPLYQWGNSFNGNSPSMGSGYSVLLAGRDYYNNVAKPDYTPLVYPHPLREGEPEPPAGPSGGSMVGGGVTFQGGASLQ